MGPLTGAQLGQVRALAGDLPGLWHNPATSIKDRKRLIRLLITDVTLLRGGDTITAHVRLPGAQDRTPNRPPPAGRLGSPHHPRGDRQPDQQPAR